MFEEQHQTVNVPNFLKRLEDMFVDRNIPEPQTANVLIDLVKSTHRTSY